MGTIYEGICPHCNYHKELYLEGGLMSVNLEASAMVLPENEQSELQQMREKDEIARFQVANYLVECKKCREIMGKTIVEVTDKKDRDHIFGEYCSFCGKRLKIYRENAGAQVKCPKCREDMMVFEEEGLWD